MNKFFDEIADSIHEFGWSLKNYARWARENPVQYEALKFGATTASSKAKNYFDEINKNNRIGVAQQPNHPQQPRNENRQHPNQPQQPVIAENKETVTTLGGIDINSPDYVPPKYLDLFRPPDDAQNIENNKQQEQPQNQSPKKSLISQISDMGKENWKDMNDLKSYYDIVHGPPKEMKTKGGPDEIISQNKLDRDRPKFEKK